MTIREIAPIRRIAAKFQADKTERAFQAALKRKNRPGLRQIASTLGVGVGTVQRISRELASHSADAAKDCGHTLLAPHRPCNPWQSRPAGPGSRPNRPRSVRILNRMTKVCTGLSNRAAKGATIVKPRDSSHHNSEL